MFRRHAGEGELGDIDEEAEKVIARKLRQEEVRLMAVKTGPQTM